MNIHHLELFYYVASDYGIRVTVALPAPKHHPKVRSLPLDSFPLVTFGVLWQGRRTTLLDAFFRSVERAARDLVGHRDAGILSLEQPGRERQPSPS
jgi:hypothetical protein